jgi:hypothetical protein
MNAPVGWERKSRGVFEGNEWAQSLADSGITSQMWDERFLFSIMNISERPLENTHPFLEHEYRLIQVSLPNALLGNVYFRIEPDDNNCTLLWIEARPFARVG